MKVYGIVKQSNTLDDGSMYCTIKCDGKRPDVDTLVELRWGRIRSTPQNSLYWLYLTFLLDTCLRAEGYESVDELHEVFKGKFLSERKEAKGGIKTIIIKSTTELTTDEFSAYIDKIDRLMANFGYLTQPFWSEYKKGGSNGERNSDEGNGASIN